MDLGLRDRVCVVSGSTGGIGLATARLLVEEGARVVTSGRSEAPAIGEALHVSGDLVNAGEPERLVETVLAELGGLDCLVNNVGVARIAAFEEVSDDEWNEYWQLDVMSYIRAIRAALPALREGRGAIVNVSSTAAFQALPGNGTYAAGKAWVLLHSEALHEEVKARGVTVTAVCPGPIRSGFQEASQPLFADRLPKFVWREPDRVARDGLRAVERGKRSVIPGGLLVKMFFGFNRVAPAWLAVPAARRMMSKELERGGSDQAELPVPPAASS